MLNSDCEENENHQIRFFLHDDGTNVTQIADECQ